jgi:phage gp46-like protein
MIRSPIRGRIRGWWADTFRTYPLGSRLWLLWREKQTETTRRRAEEYAREAMQWFIADGIAKTVEVNASWVRRGFLEITVIITPPVSERRIFRYAFPWAEIAGVAT